MHIFKIMLNSGPICDLKFKASLWPRGRKTEDFGHIGYLNFIFLSHRIFKTVFFYFPFFLQKLTNHKTTFTKLRKTRNWSRTCFEIRKLSLEMLFYKINLKMTQSCNKRAINLLHFLLICFFLKNKNILSIPISKLRCSQQPN